MIPLVMARFVAGTDYLVPSKPAVDGVMSAVWTQRWQDYGEASIVLPPGSDVEIGEFIAFPPRDTVMEVVGREETHEGVTLRCKDALAALDRRVISPTVSNDGLISTFVRKMLIQDSVVREDAARTSRSLGPFYLGSLSSIQGSAAVQRSNRPMGETLLELGRAYGFSPCCVLEHVSGRNWRLMVTARTPSSGAAVWGTGRGLSGFRVDDDLQAFRNVAYVGGQERGGERVVASTWTASTEPSGLDRREEFVDRRDVVIGGMDRGSVVLQYGDLASCGDLTATTVTSGSASPYAVQDVRMTVAMKAGGVDVTATAMLRDVLSASAWASCAADCSTSVISKTYTRKA